MNSTRFLFPAIIGGWVLAATPVGADVIVEYKFDSNATIYDPNLVVSNVTAGDFTPGPGVTGGSINTTSGVSESGRSLFANNASFNQTTEAGAESNNDYLSFAVTVDAGFHVDLTSLDFYTLREIATGGGAPSGFSVYSSADGFTAELGSGTITAVGNTNFTQQTVDLSSLQGLAGTIEFRIVFWAGDGIATPSERQWRLDEVSLDGTVEAGTVEGILVEYEFDSNGTVYDANVVAPNVSAGNFTPGPGITGSQMDTTSALSVSERSIFIDNASFNQTTEGGAVGQNDYVSFEVTVDSGFQADLTSLDFYTLRRINADGNTSNDEGAGAPSGFSVYSSADGFVTQLDSGTIPTADDSNVFTAQSADLSSLQDLAGTTEFRIIFWAGDGIGGVSERVWRLDELSLTGIIEPITVPSGDILLAITPSTSTPGNYDYSWDSQPSGKVYDLVSATSLATAPATWAVWDGRSDLPSGGTTTSLTNVPGGGETVRFFAVIEKTP